MKQKPKKKMSRKKGTLIQDLFQFGLCITIVAALLVYAFVHYDQETEENTFAVTTYVTDFSLLKSDYGGIVIRFLTEDGEYFYKVYYHSWGWNASRTKQQELTEIFQNLIANHEAVTVTVADEKDYSYIISYGADAEQAVEIKKDDGVLFSIDGHNQDQKQRKIETVIAASLILVIYIAYQGLMKFLKA